MIQLPILSLKRWRARRKLFSFIALIGLVSLIYPQMTDAREMNIEKIKSETTDKNATLADNQLIIIERLPEITSRPAKKSICLTVTAYSSSPDETQGDPFITASGTRTHHGTVAYNHLPFGTKIRFPEMFGDMVFTVEDRLPSGASYYHADMWKSNKAEAKQWGVKILKMEVL